MKQFYLFSALLPLAIVLPLAFLSGQELTEPRVLGEKQAPAGGALRVAGAYQLTGEDEWKIKWIGTLIIRSEKPGEIVGYIDWIGAGGQCGREIIEGTFEIETRRLRFTGKEIEMENSIVRAVYQAELSPNLKVIGGKWNGYRNQGPGGVFKATRIELH
ncbi:MAG: hypothetical protein AAF483_28975 [Planctomycetota bacterium]